VRDGAVEGAPRPPRAELRLGRVESRALHQRVADQLRAAIVGGDLPAGTWLREMEIAERVGVSRAPVREALRALERDGLIVSYPYRGVRVIGVDVAEAIELFTPLRQTIESYAARQLVDRAAEREGAARLEAVAATMEAHNAGLAAAGACADAAGVAAADIAFHRTLCCEADLPLVAQLWHLIEPRVERIFQTRYAVSDPLDPAYLRQLVDTHGRVVAALRARDAATAGEVLRSHIGAGMANASAAIRARAR
jgi:DNA-binding GntR family transcriptional regulator